MSKICIINKLTSECVDILYGTPWEDTEELVAAPQNDGEIGQFWNGNGWKTYEEWCEKQRQRRDKFLSVYVDTINAVRWETMPEETRESWMTYRQSLLNVPQQSDFPRSISWPTPP